MAFGGTKKRHFSNLKAFFLPESKDMDMIIIVSAFLSRVQKSFYNGNFEATYI